LPSAPLNLFLVSQVWFLTADTLYSTNIRSLSSEISLFWEKFMDVSKDLSDFRKISGKSQREFAEMLGIPQTTWSGYESGKFPPPVEILISLAEKGFTIKGLTTNFMDDMVKEGRIAKEELQKRSEIAHFLAEYASPDTPIDDNWANIVDRIYKWYKSPNGSLLGDLEKFIFNAIATQIKVSDLASRLSAIEERLNATPESGVETRQKLRAGKAIPKTPSLNTGG
jgi:transcriptional regulator with XRE-family HTH domain